MEAFNGIQFDGRFHTEVVQGTYKLFTEVKFTATLNYEITDVNKLNTMFGGQLPVDIIKTPKKKTLPSLNLSQYPTIRRIPTIMTPITASLTLSLKLLLQSIPM